METEIVNEHGSCLDTLVNADPLFAGNGASKIAAMNVDFGLPPCAQHAENGALQPVWAVNPA